VTAPVPSWAQPKREGVPTPDSALDRQFAAFIGPQWARYRRKFTPFFLDARFQPTWNWAAALSTFLGPLWFLYRKLYVPAIAFWFLPTLALSVLWRGGQVTTEDLLAGSAESQELRWLVLGVQLSTAILAGGTANFLLFRRARAALRLAQMRGATGEQALPLLARVGGVNRGAVLVMVAFVFGMLLLLRGAVGR
jgi:hypothetical protein